MFRAFFVSLVALSYTLLVGTPFLVHAVLTRNTDTLYRVGRLGTRIVLWLAGVRFEVHGLEKIPRQAAVFMANHQSNCDPPAIFLILPPILVLAKKEFFRVPILGRAMVLRGFIPVDRKNREKADRKSARLNSSHLVISYAVFCLKKKNHRHFTTE